MRFVPRQPREGINVSDVHPLAEAGALIVGLSLIFAAIVLALLFFVEFVLLFVSPGAEADIFLDWTPDDLVSVTEDDSRVVETQALVARLTAHWPDSPYTFRVEVSDDEDPNAIALPGGLIIVTTALLDSVETENELAFVLGHELGHYRNRDHIRMLGRSIVTGIVFAVLHSTEGDVSLGFTISDLALRGFSRNQESDADSFGLQIVYDEYGHVDESWRFFDRMIDDDHKATGLLNYLSTHPATDERVEDLKSYARSRGWPLTGAITGLSW